MIRQTLFRRYRAVVRSLLFLIARVLLFIPVVVRFENTEISLVFFSLATSMLASVLLSFFFEKLEHAHSIDFMSVSAHTTCQQYGRRIINAIEKQGCKVRFLLSDPDNIIWTRDEIRDALCPSSEVLNEIRDTERYLRRLVYDLKRERPSLKAGSLELRYYPVVPTASIIIVNGTDVRHTPYLPYRHSFESITYDFTKLRGGELYSRYTETFNQVWDQSREIFQETWPMKGNSKRNTLELGGDS